MRGVDGSFLFRVVLVFVVGEGFFVFLQDGVIHFFGQIDSPLFLGFVIVDVPGR